MKAETPTSNDECEGLLAMDKKTKINMFLSLAFATGALAIEKQAREISS